MSDHDIPAAVLLALTGAGNCCPDCDNDTRIRLDSHGIWHLDILHDDTCSWLNQHQQRKATQ